jgi:hypothetical protein
MTNITPGHVRAFQAITSRLYDNITLWSCRINNEPGVAIVMVDHVGESKVAVMPLFVAITPGMNIDMDGEGGSGGGGGPKREFAAAREEFARPAPQ